MVTSGCLSERCMGVKEEKVPSPNEDPPGRATETDVEVKDEGVAQETSDSKSDDASGVDLADGTENWVEGTVEGAERGHRSGRS